jgi:hypothetical protein
MLRRLWRAAIPLIAVTMIALSTDTVWAIDQKTVWPNLDFHPKAPASSGNYNFDYGPLDNKGGSAKSNARGPGLHINSGSDRRTNLGGPSNVLPGSR